jgi:hypothetical protein
MESHALITDLNRLYDADLAEHLQIDQVEALLAEKINAMINGDFGALVQLLYRVDVSESRLRQLLRGDETSEAGRLIARLILERLWQKILTRRALNGETSDGTRQDGPDDEERW